MPNYKHHCVEYDYLEIDADSAEFDNCLCEIDSDGRGPEYHKGDRVYVHPSRMEATIIKQQLMFDYPESFWGNVELQYDDGIKGIAHSWQVEKI